MLPMLPLDLAGLPDGALIFSAAIIHVLAGYPKLCPRFEPLFELHGVGRLRFAVAGHHHRRGADRAFAGA